MRIDQKICSTLVDMMENASYRDIKVSELVKTAGISRSSFYFYYDSIPAVLHKIEDDFIAGLPDEQAVVADRAANIRRSKTPKDSVQPTANFLKKHLRLFGIISGPNGDPMFQHKMASRIRRVNNMLYGLSDMSEKKRELIIEVLSGSQWYIFRWWVNHENEMSADEMAGYMSDIFKFTLEL